MLERFRPQAGALSLNNLKKTIKCQEKGVDKNRFAFILGLGFVVTIQWNFREDSPVLILRP